MDKKYTFSNTYLLFLYIGAILLGIYMGSTYRRSSGPETIYVEIGFIISLCLAEYFRRKDKKMKLEKYGAEFVNPSWRMYVILISTILMLANVGFTLSHDYLNPNNHFNSTTMPFNYVLFSIALTFFMWEKRKRKIS
jgi:urea transporter